MKKIPSEVPAVWRPTASAWRRAAVAGAVAAGAFVATPASAALAFTFDYSGNTPGVGFLDPTEGGARQAALANAGNLFSNLFGSYFGNSGALIFAVTSTNDASSPTLASAGTNQVAAPGTFGGGEVVRRKLVDGVDLNGATADGNVDVNWGYNWQLDPNTPATGPGPGQSYDFYAALFHEFTHALGFGSNISGTPGADSFGNGAEGSGTQGSWSKWDQFLTDCAANPVVNPTTYQINQTTFAAAQADGGCFTGPNAVAAFGAEAKLYANPDQSHLDETLFSTPNVAANYMMKPNRDYGPQEARDWKPLEVGILTDLGYSRIAANAVPEPASALLVLVALAGVGVARRRA